MKKAKKTARRKRLVLDQGCTISPAEQLEAAQSRNKQLEVEAYDLHVRLERAQAQIQMLDRFGAAMVRVVERLTARPNA